MKKIIPALIFCLIAPNYSMGKGVEAIIKLENSKQQAVAIENADTLEKAVYRKLVYRIKTKILGGEIGLGYATITEKRTETKREIKVKLNGTVGKLAKCFHGCNEIISLSDQNNRKYIEFKKEYYMKEDEIDPLIYCVDIKHYVKQPNKQKMIADGKRWWIWITGQGKEEAELDDKLVSADCYRLNFCEQKSNKPASPLDFYFSEDKDVATGGRISFLKGMLQIEGYLDNPKKYNP